MSVLPKLITIFDYNLNQNLSRLFFLVKIDKMILKSTWKCTGPEQPRQPWNKRYIEPGEGLEPGDLRVHWGCSSRDSAGQAPRRTRASTEPEPESGLARTGPTDSQQEQLIQHRKDTVSQMALGQGDAHLLKTNSNFDPYLAPY